MNKLLLSLLLLLSGISQAFSQDYALTKIVPDSQYYCLGATVELRVLLCDSGMTGIAPGALNINWTVSNGINESTTAPSSAIASGANDTVRLDTFLLTRPGAYEVIIWLDSADTALHNDTIRTMIFVSFSGIYTINPVMPAIGNNFQSISGAADTLSLGGVCGPVIFEIADGTYNENAMINRVHGVSETNNIIFRSQSQDSAAVLITHTPTGAADNYTFAINATSYFTLEHLSLQSTGGVLYGRVLMIDSTSAYNHYHHLRLIGDPTTTNNNTLALIYSNPGLETNDSLSVFEYNSFENGAYGMYLYGASSLMTEDSITIQCNYFKNQYVSAMFMYNQSNTIIDSNVVETNVVTNNFSGIYMRYSKDAIRISRNSIYADGAAGDLIYLREVIGTVSQPVLLSNNFIVQDNNTSSLSAIYPHNCEYVDIAYNTIRVKSGSTTGGRALYVNSSISGTYGNIKILNNIFENHGGGYAIEISSGAVSQHYISQLNYNDYLVNGSYLGKYSSVNQTDLSAWQATVFSLGFDVNSVNIDPVFTGSNDVHFTNAALNGLGTPYAFVTTDIEDDPRNATNPDMGADEYELLTHDIATLEILSPMSSCGLSAMEQITARFYNNASSDEYNIPVQFSTDGGGSWSTLELLDSIPSGDTLDYTFIATANLAVPNSYNLAVRAQLATDENATNDEANSSVISYLTITTFPYSESFEGGPGNWNSSGTNNSWALGAPANPTINSASDGTQAWVTNLSGDCNFNENSFVISPCFDLYGMSDPWLELDIWYEAESSWDGANIEYSVDGGASWQVLGFYGEPNWYNDMDVNGIASNADGWTGNNANGSGGWITVEHSLQSLTSYPGAKLRVHFGANAFNNDDGFAFDNVHIEERGIEAAIISIDAPQSGCGLGTDYISGDIANYGTMTADSIPIIVSIDGGLGWTNDTIFFSVLPNDTTAFTTSQTYDFSTPGPYHIIVAAQIPGDVNTNNDTAEITIISQPLVNAYPFFDDVDATAQLWAPQDKNWEHGTPAGMTINSAFSSSLAYSTCASGFYADTVSSFIESPCFDFSALGRPQVDFMYWVNSDTTADITSFEYTLDGMLWNPIGQMGDTLNWFTDSTGWSGTSQSTWQMARHELFMLAGEPWVKFRFVFNSDTTTNMLDGFAFDDFHVYEVPSIDIAMDSLTSPIDACEHNMETVTIKIQNTNAVETIPTGDTLIFHAEMNSSLLQIDTLILTADILPNDFMYHTFDSLADMTVYPMDYDFEIILEYANDVDANNDTLLFTVHSFGYHTSGLPSDTTLCDGQTLVLDAGAGADSYNWSTGDTTQIVSLDSSFTGGYGTDTLFVDFSANGCMSTDTIVITYTNCTGISDSENNSILIYPNPAQDYLIIDSLPMENCRISIRNVLGQEVFVSFTYGAKQTTLKTSNLTSGIYFIHIEGKNEKVSKLIIE
ncbi:MAG: T9SS type A sorting domain-containing protein [Bacteroidales bacterium]|nr:T9SS type A sorting domain-containing protein [Bacteroidales bacterium]